MIAPIVKADAFALPFKDGVFDCVVADPPYSGKNRGKKGHPYQRVGYLPFRGRDWWVEAFRVLKPSGHFYVFCAVREVKPWLLSIEDDPIDIISWIAPNNPSIAAYWRRGTGGRAPAWRPILYWQKPPKQAFSWAGLPGPRINPVSQQPIRGDGQFVDPNVFITPSIQSTMREAQPWPNQLPVKLLVYLLRPHRGLILDLFSGTGTTRVAAQELGLDVVSVDGADRAIKIIRQRPAQIGMGV